MLAHFSQKRVPRRRRRSHYSISTSFQVEMELTTQKKGELPFSDDEVECAKKWLFSSRWNSNDRKRFSQEFWLFFLLLFSLDGYRDHLPSHQKKGSLEIYFFIGKNVSGNCRVWWPEMDIAASPGLGREEEKIREKCSLRCSSSRNGLGDVRQSNRITNGSLFFSSPNIQHQLALEKSGSMDGIYSANSSPFIVLNFPSCRDYSVTLWPRFFRIQAMNIFFWRIWDTSRHVSKRGGLLDCFTAVKRGEWSHRIKYGCLHLATRFI